MKFIHYIYIGVAMMAMASCGDYNDKLDGYSEDDFKPLDIKSLKYELTSNDYVQIAVLSDNENIKKNLYIDNASDAHTYIPLWIGYTYPTADNGSNIAVTYNQLGNSEHYLAPLKKATSYTLTTEDYTAINGSATSHLTTDEIASIPARQKELRPDAAENDVVILNYTCYDTDEQTSTGSTGYNTSSAYQYNGSTWSKFSHSGTDIVVLSPSVYNSLGTTFLEDAGSIIPIYLENTYPYASNDDTKTVLYYYNKYKDIGARQYIFTNNGWEISATSEKVITEKITAPFVLSSGKWTYDPSVTLTLRYKDKTKYPESVTFYQAATDWVWNNIDVPAGTVKGKGYVSSYGNNEYYTGSSAYKGWVDWTPANAKAQNPTAFDGKTDSEIVAMMQENLIKVYAEVLKGLYPDAKTITGIDVIYTINFTVSSPNEVAYTIRYKVTGNAEFTYVEGSLLPKQ